MAAVNSALDDDSEEQTLQTLLNEDLDLADMDPANIPYYHKGLVEKKRAKGNGRLKEEEIQECIDEMNNLAEAERLGKRLSKSDIPSVEV